jgi:hypothetical protein
MVPLPLASSTNTRTTGDDVKTKLAWAPCSSSGSTASFCSQTPFPLCSSIESSHSLESPSSQFQNTKSDGSFSPPHDALEDDDNTTVMVRNLPTSLSQTGFVNELNARGYGGLFDFVYMPMNLRSAGSFGYAFVNLTSATVAAHMMAQLCSLENDDEEWRAVWSTCQGMMSNVNRYRNSPLMHESVPADCKPALYDECGNRIEFPGPTKNISKPRIHRSRIKMERENDIGDAFVKAAVGTGEHDSKPQHHPGKTAKAHRGWPSMPKIRAAAQIMGDWTRNAYSIENQSQVKRET